MIQQTLVLIKPDGVQKGLVGEIIKRFEQRGLKIIGTKMLLVNEDLAKKHYPLDEEWAKMLFEKTKKAYEKEGKELKEKTHIEMGEKIQSYLTKFIMESPVIAFAIEGPKAIESIRKIVGATEPKSAELGTIRADFASEESYSLADSEKRAVRNLIHASDSPENAKRELELWFSENEIHEYKGADEENLF